MGCFADKARLNFRWGVFCHASLAWLSSSHLLEVVMMAYDQPHKKLFFELVSWLPIAVPVWAALIFRKWRKQAICCGRWLSFHVNFLVLILRSLPTDMTHAVLLGTDMYGSFPLLMRGGLVTRIPTFLGLRETKTKWGFYSSMLFFFFFFFFLYVFGDPVCSALWNTDTTLLYMMGFQAIPFCHLIILFFYWKAKSDILT